MKIFANFVLGADGSTTIQGSSRGLSSPIDRTRFHQLRGRADVILIGGNTARLEPYSKTPCALIVLSHGQVPESIRRNSLATLWNMDLPAAIVKMRSQYKVAIIEAGPKLLREALALKLVDELHITLTSTIGGENKIELETLTQGYLITGRTESESESFLIFAPSLLP